MPERPALSARQPHAIHSALAVLEAVAQLGAGVTAREVSNELGLPRATTYRLINLLVQDEYLVRTPDLTGFALGSKLTRLSATASLPVRLSTAAQATLDDTRQAVRGGIHVALYLDGRATLVDADDDFPFSDPVRLGREPQRYALGQLLVAEHRPEATTAAARADIERLGAARRVDGLTPGYGCLAVPIRDVRGDLAGAIGFSGPRHRVEEPAAVLKVLFSAAARIGPLVT